MRPINSNANTPPQPDADNTASRSVLNGIAVSAGIVIGRAQFINRRAGAQELRRSIGPQDIEAEIARLQNAVDFVIQEFIEAKNSLAETPAAAREQLDILDVYILICKDRKILDAAFEDVKNMLHCAEWAWLSAENSVVTVFEKMDSPYLRERATDVRAVGSRVIARLCGQNAPHAPSVEKHIIFAHNLTPADTMALPQERIMAMATEMGGQTSHTGILARSMGVPCVVGVSGLEDQTPEGALAIVDGIQGFIIINPSENELVEYTRLKAEYEAYQESISAKALLPAETEDAIRIVVRGNIEHSREISLIKVMGGEGVGLYRTEFGYMSRRSLPTEEELYNDYAAAVRGMRPDRVVLRTLDVGADKNLGGHGALEEANPAMGLRAIRYCLRHQGIFRRQLKAILRASAHGNAAIMFPMISDLSELREVRSVLREVLQELDSEGIAYDKKIPVGTMIELPSAVFQASALAREVDFFSIGTNDLIQYTLGVDRVNKYVSYLYQPLHPAVIQSVRMVVDAGHEAGIDVSVCGEMASDPYCLPLLLAMGVDKLSINPRSIPAVKHLVRNFDMEELRQLLREVYASGSARATARMVSQYMYSRLGNELHFFNSATGRIS